MKPNTKISIYVLAALLGTNAAWYWTTTNRFPLTTEGTASLSSEKGEKKSAKKAEAKPTTASADLKEEQTEIKLPVSQEVTGEDRIGAKGVRTKISIREDVMQKPSFGDKKATEKSLIVEYEGKFCDSCNDPIKGTFTIEKRALTDINAIYETLIKTGIEKDANQVLAKQKKEKEDAEKAAKLAEEKSKKERCEMPDGDARYECLAQRFVRLSQNPSSAEFRSTRETIATLARKLARDEDQTSLDSLTDKIKEVEGSEKLLTTVNAIARTEKESAAHEQSMQKLSAAYNMHLDRYEYYRQFQFTSPWAANAAINEQATASFIKGRMTSELQNYTPKLRYSYMVQSSGLGGITQDELSKIDGRFEIYRRFAGIEQDFMRNNLGPANNSNVYDRNNPLVANSDWHNMRGRMSIPGLPTTLPQVNMGSNSLPPSLSNNNNPLQSPGLTSGRGTARSSTLDDYLFSSI